MRKLIKFVSAIGIVVMLSVMVGMTGTAEAGINGSQAAISRNPRFQPPLRLGRTSTYKISVGSCGPGEYLHIDNDYYAIDYCADPVQSASCTSSEITEEVKSIPVHPTLKGKVVYSDNSDPKGYGYAVVVRHYDNALNGYYYSIYGHLQNKGLPKEGTMVDTGDVIGYIGNSGDYNKEAGSLVHLHFAIREGKCRVGRVNNCMLEGRSTLSLSDGYNFAPYDVRSVWGIK